MQPAPKRVVPSGYQALNSETISAYLASIPETTKILGGAKKDWRAREVGDGNLNLVFIVMGPKGAVAVKQALPYVRLVGESWPLPLSRAHFEHLALREEGRYAPQYVPAIYFHDAPMALTIMEFLSPHIILRKGLSEGITYPHMAKHFGEFLALTLFHTSDFHMKADEKKEAIRQFLGNTAMCKITEDLVFDEPYFAAPMNRHTAPHLDDIALAFRKDVGLKTAVQDMKWRFQNQAEAMIHGDLHTGSIMVTETDTRVIDPEFAFYGPMGFDVGALIGNLLMAALAQPGHETKGGDRADYAAWILQQVSILWDVFKTKFGEFAEVRTPAKPGGDICPPRVVMDAADLQKRYVKMRLNAVWADSIGFAAAKMIRRILGLAHVADFETIENLDLRAACERRVLKLARDMLIDRNAYASPADLAEAIRTLPP